MGPLGAALRVAPCYTPGSLVWRGRVSMATSCWWFIFFESSLKFACKVRKVRAATIHAAHPLDARKWQQ